MALSLAVVVDAPSSVDGKFLADADVVGVVAAAVAVDASFAFVPLDSAAARVSDHIVALMKCKRRQLEVVDTLARMMPLSLRGDMTPILGRRRKMDAQVSPRCQSKEDVVLITLINIT